MAKIPGTAVASPLVPNDDRSTRATHQAQYGKGGLRRVATIAALDDIPIERREYGMLVFVDSIQSYYQCGPSPALAFGAAPFVPGPGADTIYANTTAGLAAVTEGEYFYVADSNSLTLYRDVAGVATEIGEFPTLATLAAQVSAASSSATDAETAQTAAEAAQTAAEAAQTAAELAEANAETAQTNAETAATASATSATASATSATASATSATEALGYRDQARAAADATPADYLAYSYNTTAPTAVSIAASAPDGATILILADESAEGGGYRTIREVDSLAVNSIDPTPLLIIEGDAIRTDLASTDAGKGAELVNRAARTDQNLSDLDSASTARANLGLGTAATVDTGTGPDQVGGYSAYTVRTAPTKAAAESLLDASAGYSRLKVGDVVAVTSDESESGQTTYYPIIDSGGGTPAFGAVSIWLSFSLATVSTLAELKASQTTTKRVNVLGRTTAGDGYGGSFDWLTGDFTDYVAADSQEAVYVASNSVAASVGCWVREIKDAIYNIRYFGALGNGVASVDEDTAALSGAFTLLRYLQSQGFPIRLFNPKPSVFYAYNGPGEYGIDDLEFFGNDFHWRHVDPDQGTWFRGTIIYPGTYAGGDSQNIELETKYPINDISAGSNLVVFDTSGDSNNFVVGDLVILSSGASYEYTSQPTNTRYTALEVNEVVAISAGVLTLKYGSTDDYITDSLGNSPNVRRLNTGLVQSSSGMPHRVSRRMKIHGGKFSVADTDEVNGGALSNIPSAALQVGGTFESDFYDLEIEGYQGWVGNLWCRSSVQAKIRSYNQVFDSGYGSHNSHFDFDWSFRPSVIGGSQASLFYFHEGSHDITANIKAYGPQWSGTNVFSCGPSRRISCDVDVYLPDLVSNASCIEASDVSAEIYVTDLRISGKIDLGQTGKIGRWIRAVGLSFPVTTITNVIWSAGVATYSSVAHGLVPNAIVHVSGIVGSILPSPLNGLFQVLDVPTADTFTVAMVDDPGSYISGGSAKRYNITRSDFSRLRFYGGDEGSHSADMVRIVNHYGDNLTGLSVPVGGIVLSNVIKSNLGMIAPLSNIDISGATEENFYHSGIFGNSVGSYTPTEAFVAGTYVLSNNLQMRTSRISSKSASITATNGVAVEFQSAVALSAEPGAVYDVRAKSNDVTTRAIAVVYVSFTGVVTVDTLASTAGLITTDGTNLMYTNSSGADRTVIWTMLRTL